LTKAIVAKVWELGVDATSKRRTKPPFDVTPPTIPSSLVLTAQSTTSILATSNIAVDAQSGVREYIFEFCLSGAGVFVEHGRAQHPPTASTVSYLLDGLTAATNYDVRVKAVDNSGNISGVSAVVSRTTLSGPAPPSGYAPAFPRLGAVIQAGTQNYDLLANRVHWSKFHVLSMTHYNKWQGNRTMTMAQVHADMDARCPIPEGQLRFCYIIQDSYKDVVGPTDAANKRVIDKLNAESWWVYVNGASGTKVSHIFQRDSTTGISPFKVTPLWPFCPRDSGGKDFLEWHVDLMVTQNVTGETGNSPNALWAGFMCDDLLAAPQWGGDMNRDGTAEAQSDPQKARWMRDTIVRYFAYLRQVWPQARYQIGNTSWWGDPTANLDVLTNLSDGGLMEGIMGKSYAPHTWGSFQQMGEYYRKQQDAFRSPRLAVFMDFGNTATGYARMRYGLGSCMVLGDGYYMPGGPSYSPDHRFWLEEFDIKGVGWLGQPIEPRQTAARYHAATDSSGSGIWRRDFQKDSTVYTVLVAARRGRGQIANFDQATAYAGGQSLGGTWKRLTGTQDAAFNNGATGITTVPAMVPQTAIFLEKTA
jgi:hypothetical protein